MKSTALTTRKAAAPKEGVESVAMGMAAGSINHLMSVLTNLYSNANIAVLREVVSNGIDAHVRAGVDSTVQVTLPSHKNGNILTVRDFGNGMSRETITDIYSQYGASTKRDSNEEMGGFGLGAKSPLAITDRFEVTSINNGIRIDFYIEKNEEDAPVLYFENEVATDEPSGVEVRVPYASGLAEFSNSNVIDNLEKFFAGVPANSISFNGRALVDNVYNTDIYTNVGGETADGQGVSWTRSQTDYYNGSNIYFVIAGIRYRANKEALYTLENLSENVINDIHSLRRDVYLNIPVGSVRLTPSRESLMYKGNTLTTLVEVLNQFHADLHTHYVATLNRATTHQEALEVYTNIAEHGYNRLYELKWRGEDVPSSFDPKDAHVVIDIDRYTGRANRSYVKNNRWNFKAYFSKNTSRRTIILTVDEETATDKDKMLASTTMLRRYIKNLNAFIGDGKGDITDILVINEKDTQNGWFNFATLDKYKTVTHLSDELREYSLEIARKARADKPKVVNRKAVGVTYSWTPGADRSVVFSKAFAGEEWLQELVDNNNIYYIHRDNSYGFFPHSNVTKTGATEVEKTTTSDPRNFRKLFNIAIGDYPVFLVTGQVEVFKRDFPNAQDARTLIIEYANATFVPEIEYGWHEISGSNYTERYELERLIQYYTEMEQHKILDDVKKDWFKEIAEFRTLKDTNGTYEIEKENAEERVIHSMLENWADYSSNDDADRIKLIDNLTERAKAVRKKAWFIAKLNVTGLNKEKLQQMVQFINTVD